MITGAIFDMDGTLLDSMYIWRSATSGYLRSRGIEVPIGIDAQYMQLSMLECAVCLKERFGFSQTPEEITAQVNRQIEHEYFEIAPAKQGVKKFLTDLKINGVKLCVATATDRYLAEAALKRTGLFTYFSFLITCADVGVGKNSPDVFQAALSRLGSDKQCTVIFEDSLHAINTAHNAGFRVVAVRDEFSYSDAEKIERLAERTVNTLDECEVASL